MQDATVLKGNEIDRVRVRSGEVLKSAGLWLRPRRRPAPPGRATLADCAEPRCGCSNMGQRSPHTRHLGFLGVLRCNRFAALLGVQTLTVELCEHTAAVRGEAHALNRADLGKPCQSKCQGLTS